MSSLDWDKWFYAPGLPPKPAFDTSLVDVVYDLAEKWKSLTSPSATSTFQPQASDIQGLTANQIVVFLEQLLNLDEKAALSADLSKKLGQVYGFAGSENVEVANLYLQVGLKAREEGAVQATPGLLGRIGRMKFVRPLYVFPLLTKLLCWVLMMQVPQAE